MDAFQKTTADDEEVSIGRAEIKSFGEAVVEVADTELTTGPQLRLRTDDGLLHFMVDLTEEDAQRLFDDLAHYVEADRIDD